MPRIGTVLLAVCMLGLFVCKTANADSLEPLNYTWHLDAGVFLVDTDTTVRVDGHDGTIGNEVDFKHDFGFKDSDRFRLDGYWRFFKRHKLRVMYFDNSSDAERTISRDIHFGDNVFPLNASVKASVDTQIIEVAYEYSLWRSDSFELAGTIGLHNLRVTMALSAAASSTGLGTDLRSTAEGNGPLPVIGMRFIWALNNQFYFDGLAQFFALKIDNYDGSLSDYKLDFVWKPIKNFGVGVGYNQFTTRLDVTSDKFNGKLKFDYGGPLLFVNVSF